MAVFLSFSLEGEQQLLRRISGLKDKNLQPAFERIGRKLVEFYSGAVFSTQGAAIGASWPGGPNYHGLVRTGAMRSSFDYSATATRFELFNKTDYFMYHQSNKARHKLPRRVMLKLDNPRKMLVVKEVQQEYADELKKR